MDGLRIRKRNGSESIPLCSVFFFFISVPTGTATTRVRDWASSFLHFAPCVVLRANHHVMDRSSMPPLGSALRAILTVIENWTSVTIPILRSIPGLSPHQWPRLSSRMFEAVNHICLTIRPRWCDCNAQTLPCKTSVYCVNPSLYLLFAPRHVPLIREAMQMLYASPPSLCPPQLVPR